MAGGTPEGAGPPKQTNGGSPYYNLLERLHLEYHSRVCRRQPREGERIRCRLFRLHPAYPPYEGASGTAKLSFGHLKHHVGL